MSLILRRSGSQILSVKPEWFDEQGFLSRVPAEVIDQLHHAQIAVGTYEIRRVDLSGQTGYLGFSISADGIVQELPHQLEAHIWAERVTVGAPGHHPDEALLTYRKAITVDFNETAGELVEGMSFENDGHWHQQPNQRYFGWAGASTIGTYPTTQSAAALAILKKIALLTRGSHVFNVLGSLDKNSSDPAVLDQIQRLQRLSLITIDFKSKLSATIRYLEGRSLMDRTPISREMVDLSIRMEQLCPVEALLEVERIYDGYGKVAVAVVAHRSVAVHHGQRKSIGLDVAPKYKAPSDSLLATWEEHFPAICDSLMHMYMSE